MLGLEQLAAEQDPLLREALKTRGAAARENAQSALQAGDATDAQAFFAQRRAEFTQKLQADTDSALNDANARLSSIGAKRTDAENSLTVSREIESALERSLQQERTLWAEIPKGERVPTQSAKATAETILDETAFAQKGDIPQAVRDLLSNPDTYGKDATVRDMHGLYSELRRQARTAMAGADQNKNKARIANEVAEAVLEDLGATDGATTIGQQINTARAFSAALHDTFDKGAPGRLLRRTLDGDTAIDPELSLKRTVGRGGTEGAVTSQQIESAAGPQTPVAVQDYIKGLFSKRAMSPAGEFTRKNALVFIRDNKELLARYPELRQEIDDAVKQGETAAQVAEKVTQRISALSDAKRSAVQGFVDMPPEKAITAVLDAKNPVQAAGRLANEARKDRSGKALAGVKGAFADYLINSASKVKVGETAVSGDAMLRILGQPKTRAALARIYKPAEMKRLNLIASELAKLDNALRPAANIGENLSGARANRFIEIPLRIIAANIGAQQGTGGASLQTAQMASSRVKEAMNHLAADKASQMIADSVTDPELFKALLTGARAPKLDERIMPWLLPYLVAGAIGSSEH
ncbi:hypothetical protein [uncultured Roseobacter sp.]|uniref:hypothetical protein n=1 Tax=uncultured Roseobacter sp. TaxID=114847 RepID=UPI0026164CC8|nr:hypothetical protein [uncultured Roseobacter sp.]